MLDAHPLIPNNDITSHDVAMLPIDIKGLTLRVGERNIIDHLDCRIEHARRIGIIGANGAGKSVFLRLLHGLITPTEGTITWGGKPATAAVRQSQAMVFQRPVMLRRSVSDNLRFSLKQLPLSKADGTFRLQQALQLARLEDKRNTPARQLSGGEQQRLALARALASKPAILFLDEPTANLDPASTHAVEEMINLAYQQGTMIILVSHEMGQVKRLCDEVIFLHKGQMTERQATHRFITQPASEAARAYLEGRIYLD